MIFQCITAQPRPVDEIIDAAEANTTGKPVIVADSADSPNGGAVGDSPVVALRLMERGSNLRAAMFVKDPAAVKYEELSFDKAIEDRLKVMDQTAFALCREGNMPIIVFDMNQKGNLTKLVKGEKVGTLVHV